MTAARELCGAVLSKVEEQIERTIHLAGLVPAARTGWQPASGGWTIDLLLGHLLECLAGFCAVLAAANPEALAHFGRLRDLPVNQPCSPEEAVARIRVYRDHIEEGFRGLQDSDLAKRVPTIFVPDGEPLLTLLLGNLEHLINHKHQLFTYLKEMGIEVSTRDLYRFRGE